MPPPPAPAMARPAPEATPAQTTTRQDDPRGPGAALGLAPTPAVQNGAPVKKHHRIVLPDPLAFRYLSDDPSTAVLEYSREIQGFQLYVVEQWACSRNHPTLAIVTYTGDTNHRIRAGVLGVPADEAAWSVKLKTYFKALSQYHAKRRDTPLGLLMVTNLSSFPSSLTLVPIPDGDLRKARESFFLSENLKRLGCSGRVGLTLSEPSSATQNKFNQVYKTSEKISLGQAVIELVKTCQIALLLFGCLDEAYADGLLCDETERAINDWWVNIGAELYNVEPNDGILGPTTVAALVGTLVGARNRFSALNLPVGKDAFDVVATERAASQFQKSQRLPRSRKLDRETLFQLHRTTAKQASNEGWTVPKAVKSTVAELSGKGGEMVMEMVGRDKAKISEVETVNYDAFVAGVSGDRAKWLWHGKARKRTTRDLFADAKEARRSVEDPDRRMSQDVANRGDLSLPSRGFRVNRSVDLEEPLAKQTVLNRARGKLREKVRRNQHHYTRSNDEYSPYLSGYESMDGRPSVDAALGARDVLTSSDDVSTPAKSASASKHGEFAASPSALVSRNNVAKPSAVNGESLAPPSPPVKQQPSPILAPPIDLDNKLDRIISNELTTAETLDDVGVLPEDNRPAANVGIYLRENASFTRFEMQKRPQRAEAYYAPRLSFSTAEAAVMPINELIDDFPPPTSNSQLSFNPRKEFAREILLADRARHFRAAIAKLGSQTAVWLQQRVNQVSELDDVVSGDVDQLRGLLHPRLQEHAALAASARDIIGDERERLTEAVKDVETLASKLTYEVDGFRGKVEDLESAVDEFQRQVAFTEQRVEELVRTSEKEGWGEFVMRRCFGVVRRKESDDDASDGESLQG